MQFTKTLKSSIAAMAVTAALIVPTAASAQAAPVVQAAAPSAVTVTAAKTSYAVGGAIRATWLATKSRMGNPTSREIRGLKNGGAAQNFQRGAIVWSPKTGAKISVGGIRGAWLRAGAQNGKLGYPKTNEYNIRGGLRQDYQGGSVIWSRSTSRTTVQYPAVKKPAVKPAAAPKVNNSVAGAKAFAKWYLPRVGFAGSSQYNCLVHLWNHESGWNFRAANPYSGAYGIPQSLPGGKTASHGRDWRMNSQTQIKWGVSYIKGRYGSPCGAYNSFRIKGWY